MAVPFRFALHQRVAVVASAVVVLAGCAALRPTRVPMRTVATQAGASRARALVVFLPGRASGPEEFAQHGFVEALSRRGLAVDTVAADAHLGYYRKGTILTRLWEDVIEPARRLGYEEIWLAGISLGGSGALGLAREHPDAFAGVILLAPYLGDDELVRAIRAAGGPAHWRAPATPDPDDRRRFFQGLWSFLGEYDSGRAAEVPKRPELWIGWGRADRFAATLELAATLLPPERVLSTEGGHSWSAWRRLWDLALRDELGPRPGQVRAR